MKGEREIPVTWQCHFSHSTMSIMPGKSYFMFLLLVSLIVLLIKTVNVWDRNENIAQTKKVWIDPMAKKLS